MNNPQEQLETLREIRELMAKSSRFLSLSGLSGVFAGLYAMVGAFAAWYFLGLGTSGNYYDRVYERGETYNFDVLSFFLVDAMLVLGLSLLTGYLLTRRKARKAGHSMFGATAFRLLINLFLPLAVGGIFCLLLLHHRMVGLVAPSTLIFYGLALLNASKYTLNDIRYLGVAEILLGLIGCYFIGHGLLIWAIGFGVLHIVYGAYMYFKYDR